MELVTVSGGAVIDRRRIDLTEGLPTHPYHHEGAWAVGRYTNSPWARKITLEEAIELVQRVEKAAAKGARQHLEELAKAVRIPIAGVAIRLCPELPPTIEERIRDNRAQTMADSVMYRLALAAAAEERNWPVCWYDRDRVFDDAAAAIGCKDITKVLTAMGKETGPPWQARHKLAAAAAIAASAQLTR